MIEHIMLHALDFIFLCKLHAIIPETIFSSFPDICNPLHCAYCSNIHLSVVLQRFVSLLLEFQDAVFCDFFIMELSVGFSPGHFSGVMFGLEVSMTFGSAKFEHFAIISHECNSMAWVNRTGAEITTLNTHQQLLYIINRTKINRKYIFLIDFLYMQTIERPTAKAISQAPLVPIPKNSPSDLKNIIEVTQQNDNEVNVHKQDSDVQNCKQLSPIPKTNLPQNAFSRYFRCIRNMCRWIRSSELKREYMVTEDDFTDIIYKIKNKKNKPESVIPPQNQLKKVLVLDLDETLIHTTFTRPEKFDYEIQMIYNGRKTTIFTIKRFGLESFLFEMSKLYQLIIFTASQKCYADQIIDLIDPKNRISHRLYRDDCIIVNKQYYLKNLRMLGRNLQDMVIIDDNAISGILQPQNFFKIDSFTGNTKDRSLCRLSAFLKHIHDLNWKLSIIDMKQKYDKMEINVNDSTPSTSTSTKSIEEKDFDRDELAVNQKKRQYKHKKTNSQVQSLAKGNEEEQQDVTQMQLVKKSAL